MRRSCPCAHQLYDAVQSQLDVDLDGRANIRRRGDVVLQLRIVVNQKLDKTQCMHSTSRKPFEKHL